MPCLWGRNAIIAQIRFGPMSFLCMHYFTSIHELIKAFYHVPEIWNGEYHEKNFNFMEECNEAHDQISLKIIGFVWRTPEKYKCSLWYGNFAVFTIQIPVFSFYRDLF